MLTGSSETIKHATSVGRPEAPARNPIPPMKTGPNKKPSKLYEQRNSLKNFKISPLVPESPGVLTRQRFRRRDYLISLLWRLARSHHLLRSVQQVAGDKR
ncbi:hypothetical protein R6Q57_010082 [Mikania cordata]